VSKRKLACFRWRLLYEYRHALDIDVCTVSSCTYARLTCVTVCAFWAHFRRINLPANVVLLLSTFGIVFWRSNVFVLISSDPNLAVSMIYTTVQTTDKDIQNQGNHGSLCVAYSSCMLLARSGRYHTFSHPTCKICKNPEPTKTNPVVTPTSRIRTRLRRISKIASTPIARSLCKASLRKP